MKIDSIKVTNFKSLKKIELTLSNLTLITGVNSSGKSSLIQILLLLKENITTIKNIVKFEDDMLRNMGLSIKLRSGEYVKLGNKKQLLNHESSDENITFEVGGEAGLLKILINSKFDINLLESNKSSENLLNAFNNDSFCYLNTDRSAPANDFPFSEEIVDKQSIGLNGEYTAHYLDKKRHHTLDVKLLQHPRSVTSQLLENTSKWLGEISSGVSILATPYPELQRVSLSYQYEYGDTTSGIYSPLNVGFGLTYALPVIVAILKSKPGDLLIIENPESHLHPAGQAKIAELCAIAAHNGVQIIIESHSDHFLNGLRVATKNKVIDPKKSQIYYFEKKQNSLNTIAHSINIDKEGKIDNWPTGFFDEWDNQLDKLLW